jgi:hypothetical protein
MDTPREIHIFDHCLAGPCHNMQHGILKGMMYEETLEASEDRFGDQHLDA